MVSEWERAERRRQAEAEFEEREQQARRLNEEIEDQLVALDSTLARGVYSAPALNYDQRLIPVPDLRSLVPPMPRPAPSEEDFMLPEPGPLARLLPGWEKRHQQKQEKARADFRAQYRRWRSKVDANRADYDERVATLKSYRREALKHNEGVRRLQEDAAAGKRAAVEDYVLWALGASNYGFKLTFGARFVPSRNELLLEVTYPNVDAVIPELGRWTHIKSRKTVEPKKLTIEDRNKRYRRLLAQITLRVIFEALHVDAFGHIKVVAFKGMVHGISPVTGRSISPTVISLRVEREEFLDREFARIDATKLLQSFRANVSDQPAELKPVPLVVDFDLNDPRFIEEEDVISRMDDRANLMDVTPAQFESIITNLFNSMGYKAKQTVRSKDGGVDCVAFFEDPVGVIKCVIQAKKWTQVVGVDAVRDLYGSMTHERASKAILVTTSKVTEGGKRFAADKPMQIVEGEELLDLFEKWTDHRLTIVFPPK